jgi:hypothetical protein
LSDTKCLLVDPRLVGRPLVLTNPANITIVGPGARRLTIGGGGKSGIFDVEGGSLTLSGLTIENGNADLGGGLRNEGGRLALTRVVIQGNRAGGGGLFNDGRTTLSGVTIKGNHARIGPELFNTRAATLLWRRSPVRPTAATREGNDLTGDNLSRPLTTFGADFASASPGFTAETVAPTDFSSYVKSLTHLPLTIELTSGGNLVINDNGSTPAFPPRLPPTSRSGMATPPPRRTPGQRKKPRGRDHPTAPFSDCLVAQTTAIPAARRPRVRGRGCESSGSGRSVALEFRGQSHA